MIVSPPGQDSHPLPHLVINARMVVCAGTTMIVEAAIFRQKILILAYPDRRSPCSPADILRTREHFKGAENIPGVFFANALETFESDFESLLFTPPETLDWHNHAQKLAYLLYMDERPYSQRLKHLLERITEVMDQQPGRDSSVTSGVL